MKEDYDDIRRQKAARRRRRRRQQRIKRRIVFGGILVFFLLVIVLSITIAKKFISSTNTKSDELTTQTEDTLDLKNGEIETADTSVDSSTIEDEDTTTDPQNSVAEETGSAVDVADLVNASTVGENSSLTYGIDVSKFQGTIDWAQVAGTGIDFAIVRVGYRDSSTGEIKEDTNAKYNMQEAEKNGIKVGAYFFSTAISSDEAVEEADWVANYISQYSITYPVGYNCEGFEKSSSRQYGLSKDERSSIAIAFLNEVYAKGYTPMFYASKNELSGDAKWKTSEIQNKFKIWMAWYNQDTSNIANGPAYDGQCAMWQYTNQGTIAGISQKVDVDVAYFGYNGTASAQDTSERENASADVEALMNFDEVNETVTAKSQTNLRNIPSQGSDSTVMLTLSNGQTATRTGVSSSGWSRVVYNGTTYYAVSSYLTTDLSAPAQTTQAPEPETTTTETYTGFRTKFTDVNDVVTAKEMVNLRSKPSVTDEDSTVVATLYAGTNITRTGINTDYGWSRVEYEGQVLYCVSSYLKVVE